MADKNIQAIYPLTPMQEGILFHTLESPRAGMYFNQFTCRIEGPLDTDRFERVWQAAFAGHAVLRTLFTWERRDRPLQIVRRRVTAPWTVIDWRDRNRADADAVLKEFLQADRDKGFDLNLAPLSRLALIRLDTDLAQMVWSFHHIVLDGWSVRLVFDEVMRNYHAAKDTSQIGQESPSFETFVGWQRKRDQSRDRQFWQQRLDGFSSATTPEIRLHGNGPDDGGRAGQQTEIRLATTLSGRIAAMARAERVTLNTVIVAAWSILLARYCDSNDVVFGTTVAGRTGELEGVDSIVGLLINTLPLRARLEDELTVSGLLRQVQTQQVEQQPFEQTSLQEVRRCSQVAASMPLFETILVFENLPEAKTDVAGILAVSNRQFIEHSNFPLALLVVPGDELEFIVVHDGRRYSRGAVQQMLRALQFVLGQLVDGVHALVQNIVATPTDERQRLLHAGTGEPYRPRAGQESVLHMFEARAEDSRDSIAATDGNGTETYGSLNKRANRLARRLQRDYSASGRPIVIFAQRSIDAVVAMLAVLKCGSAYVPMDVNDPGARLWQVASDLAQRFSPEATVRPLILTQADFLGNMPTEVADVALIAPDESPEDSSNIAHNVQGNDLAYVIYTSGSTGEPKGVAVQHDALLNSNLARFQFYDDQPSSFALLSSLATDSSLAGIYWTLCAGGTLVIPPPRAELDVEQLSALIKARDVSHILCVPSLYSLILDNAELSRLQSLRVVIVAGEASNDALAIRHRVSLPNARLFNEYGPSEACVWTTAAELDGGLVSIGRPIANTATYVLDSRRRVVPCGVAGELYIGGANVTLGYLGRPEGTSAVFIEDPFATDGTLMYRTRDRVRIWDDGRLEFLGRCDLQIKIRGFRIEPGEVEAALAAHPEITEAVVHKRSSASGEQLVAVVAGSITESANLREFCEQALPRYMVPQQFIVLERLPKTPAGKTDRDAVASLTQFEDMPSAAGSGVAPRTPQEKMLAAIWCDVLGLEEIYVFDNFFEVGGDSLMTIRILSRASREGFRIGPEQFFEHPTIAGQAAIIQEAHETNAAEEDSAGPLPLLPIQQWFFRNVRTDPHHWNLSYLFDIDPAVEAPNIEQALTSLLQRHAALRTQFSLSESTWSAEVVDVADITVESVNLGAAASERKRKLVEDVAERLNSNFELARAPLLRACHFTAEAGRPHHLLLVIHHLVIDVESWRIIIADLETLLRQGSERGSLKLSEPVPSVLRWAKQLQKQANSAELDADRVYWATLLADGVPELPTDGDRSVASNRERDTMVRSFAVDRKCLESLSVSARESLRASMFQIVLSSVARAIACWAPMKRVVFDTEGHGREPLFPGGDVSAAVGWLTSVFPLVFDVDESTWSDAVAALRTVKERIGNNPRNGISFGMLRDLASAEDDDIDAYSGADLLFNYLGGVEMSSEEDSILALTDMRCGPARSPDCERAYPVEINAYLARGELIFDVAFSKEMFANETIDRLGHELVHAVAELADSASRGSSNATVGADFPLADLSAEDFASVAGQLDALDE